MRSIRLDGMGFILYWFHYVTGDSGDDGNIARVSVVYVYCYLRKEIIYGNISIFDSNDIKVVLLSILKCQYFMFRALIT